MPLTLRKLLCPVIIAAVALSTGFEMFELRIPAAAAKPSKNAKQSTSRKVMTQKSTRRKVSRRPGRCGPHRYFNRRTGKCADAVTEMSYDCGEGYHWSDLSQDCVEDSPGGGGDSRRIMRRKR